MNAVHYYAPLSSKLWRRWGALPLMGILIKKEHNKTQTYIYTHTCICIHTCYIHIFMNGKCIYMHACMHTYILIHPCIRPSIYTYTFIRTCTHSSMHPVFHTYISYIRTYMLYACMFECLFLNLCMYVYLSMYIYTGSNVYLSLTRLKQLNPENLIFKNFVQRQQVYHNLRDLKNGRSKQEKLTTSSR